jgi:hypothetical protein
MIEAGDREVERYSVSFHSVLSKPPDASSAVLFILDPQCRVVSLRQQWFRLWVDEHARVQVE